MVDRKLLTVEQVMEHLQISRSTLFRYIKQGLPKVQLSARKVFFDQNEVDDWVKKRTEQFKE